MKSPNLSKLRDVKTETGAPQTENRKLNLFPGKCDLVICPELCIIQLREYQNPNGIPVRTNLQIQVYEITICLYSLEYRRYISEDTNVI